MESDLPQKAYLALYTESADAAFRHAYFRTHDRDVAKDLMQESFMRMWEYLANGKEIANYRAFLFRTLNNLIIDYWRKKKETSLDSLAEAGFDPPGDNQEQVSSLAEGREVLKVLDGLEESYRDVIVLRYIDDLSITEIAAILEESENAVSVRLHRAIKKLKELLNHGPS